MSDCALTLQRASNVDDMLINFNTTSRAQHFSKEKRKQSEFSISITQLNRIKDR